MHKTVYFHSLPGLSDYNSVWEMQKKFQQEIIELKFNNICEPAGHLIFCEHPHVYTLGRFGKQSNMLIDNIKLQAIEAQFINVDRGGDITYHGPEQLVCYPIFNLEIFKMGVKNFVHTIEQCIIDMLGEYEINANALAGATGVWLDNNKSLRKICAIGIKVNNNVTMHGLALNVNTNLNYFNYINPCGFTDKNVTSMEKELGCKQDLIQVRDKLLFHFQKLFGFGIREVNTYD